MNEISERTAVELQSLPPMSLDKFMELSGFSAVTIWRYRKKGWLKTINIAGRQYITRSAIAEFNKRAERGEFSKEPAILRRIKNHKPSLM